MLEVRPDLLLVRRVPEQPMTAADGRAHTTDGEPWATITEYERDSRYVVVTSTATGNRCVIPKEPLNWPDDAHTTDGDRERAAATLNYGPDEPVSPMDQEYVEQIADALAAAPHRAAELRDRMAEAAYRNGARDERRRAEEDGQHGPRHCVSVENVNRVLAEERAAHARTAEDGQRLRERVEAALRDFDRSSADGDVYATNRLTSSLRAALRDDTGYRPYDPTEDGGW